MIDVFAFLAAGLAAVAAVARWWGLARPDRPGAALAAACGLPVAFTLGMVSVALALSRRRDGRR